MRTWLVMPVVAIAGCSSQWELPPGENILIGCEQKPYFLDLDLDGWGDPEFEGSMLCAPDVASSVTVRNNRDCDDDPDSGGAVTGLIGSVCPDRLVESDTSYTALIYDGYEYVVVQDPSEPKWSTYADDACSPWGWGGGLAGFSAEADVAQVQAAIEAAVGDQVYAGWIGLVDDSADGWTWDIVDLDGNGPDEGDLNYGLPAIGDPALGDLAFCDGVPSAEDIDPSNPQNARLALVKRADGEWCVGTPDQVVDEGEDLPDDSPEYTANTAHFICKRGEPAPEDFAVNSLE